MTKGSYTLRQVVPESGTQTNTTASTYAVSNSNEAGGPAYSWFDISSLGTNLQLGDEERARSLAAELAEIDKDCKPIILGKPKKKLLASLPGSSVVARLAEMLETELSHSGQALWLYRP